MWPSALLRRLSRLLPPIRQVTPSARAWPDMARIVLVMHKPLGSAFAVCAEHVLGQKPELTVFDVAPDADPESQVTRLAARLLETPNEATLVLCDIFGATPFNIAKRAIKLATDRGL